MHENSWNFCRKSSKICRTLQARHDLKNDFNLPGKDKQPASIICAFGPKWKQNLNFFEIFLIKISLENGLFHNFLLNISWSSASFLNYYTLEENTFLQQSFRFRDGDVTASSSVGRGGTPERHPLPRNRKIVVEIWSYLQDVYTYFRIWVWNPRNI